MSRKWIFLLIALTSLFWSSGQPQPGQTAVSLLELAFEPLLGDADTTFTAVVKNFSWEDMALVQVTAIERNTNESMELRPASAPLAVGPRRRANLNFAPGKAGLWTLRVQGTWLDGGALSAAALLPVATAGSTTGEIGLGQTVEGLVRPGTDGFGIGVWSFVSAGSDDVAIELDRNLTASSALILLDRQFRELAQDEDFIGNITLSPDRYFVLLQASEELAYRLTLREGLRGDQEGGVIAFDTAVSGLIEPRNDVDIWSFSALPGDVAVITLRPPAASQLAGELLLYDAAGNQVAREATSFRRAVRLTYLVPAAGEYQLVAQSFNQQSSGLYRLTLMRGPRADENVTLRHFQPRQGQALAGGAQAWQFQGQAGERLVITANALDQAFDPYLILYGPDGVEIASDDDGGEGLNARLEITLPVSGLYTASVTSYDGSSGRYLIEILRP